MLHSHVLSLRLLIAPAALALAWTSGAAAQPAPSNSQQQPAQGEAAEGFPTFDTDAYCESRPRSQVITGSEQTVCDVVEQGARADAQQSWSTATDADRATCERDAVERARALGIEARQEAGLAQDEPRMAGSDAGSDVEAGSYVTLMSCLDVRARFSARKNF
ncbi:hypothetical protein [Marinivivus vitaminiproducens]|uniref:hypothetical protein n=1 Tax=Marinivivus vitaminiproducens TaxID=3035935 RepID=UPI0027A6CEAA|nr:hypothetical protein P4R82_09470 [Geminicoccaceae bacterium SCSIO 64248]